MCIRDSLHSVHGRAQSVHDRHDLMRVHVRTLLLIGHFQRSAMQAVQLLQLTVDLGGPFHELLQLVLHERGVTLGQHVEMCIRDRRQAAPRGTGRSRSFRRCIRSASIPFAQDAEPAGHPVAGAHRHLEARRRHAQKLRRGHPVHHAGRQSGQSHQHDSGHPKHFAVHETIYVACLLYTSRCV